MKKYIGVILLVWSVFLHKSNGQTTLEKCQDLSRKNYPGIQQSGLIQQLEAYDISNVKKGYLPQFSLSARATYQTDVTKIPKVFGDLVSALPGLEGAIPDIPKDQYQITAEVNQMIWDGGITQSRQNSIRASAEVDRQQTEVELYQIKDRVNQLFFGILIIDEYLAMNELLQKELQTNFDRIQISINNGVANKSDADILLVELVKALQKKDDLKATQNGYKEMLAAMTGDNSVLTDTLVIPYFAPLMPVAVNDNRPEWKLFDAQSSYIQTQEKLIRQANLPKFLFFGQGGYGNPGLDMFKSGFTPFFIGGLKFVWNFGGYYTQENQLNQLAVNKQKVEVMKESFTYNNRLKVIQLDNEKDRILGLIQHDDAIIAMRKRIKESAIIKVEHGTMSTTDLVSEINAENAAILDKSLHRIQLLQTICNIKNINNN